MLRNFSFARKVFCIPNHSSIKNVNIENSRVFLSTNSDQNGSYDRQDKLYKPRNLSKLSNVLAQLHNLAPIFSNGNSSLLESFVKEYKHLQKSNLVKQVDTVIEENDTFWNVFKSVQTDRKDVDKVSTLPQYSALLYPDHCVWLTSTESQDLSFLVDYTARLIVATMTELGRPPSSNSDEYSIVFGHSNSFYQVKFSKPHIFNSSTGSLNVETTLPLIEKIVNFLLFSSKSVQDDQTLPLGIVSTLSSSDFITAEKFLNEDGLDRLKESSFIVCLDCLNNQTFDGSFEEKSSKLTAHLLTSDKKNVGHRWYNFESKNFQNYKMSSS